MRVFQDNLNQRIPSDIRYGKSVVNIL